VLVLAPEKRNIDAGEGKRHEQWLAVVARRRGELKTLQWAPHCLIGVSREDRSHVAFASRTG
jgi:hypothetical protein